MFKIFSQHTLLPKSVQLALARQDEEEQDLFLRSRLAFADLPGHDPGLTTTDQRAHRSCEWTAGSGTLGQMKAASWVPSAARAACRLQFGALNVVPVAVLSGVYKLHNLMSAQTRGLTLYWAHDLVQLLDWIEAGRHA